jgi:hypothetical protein
VVYNEVDLLRPIPVEHDPDHDHRAECDHHSADHRQLFEHGDNACAPAKSSLHMRETPACHTHSETPFGPQQRRILSTQSARLTIANSGVPSDQGKEPVAFRLEPDDGSVRLMIQIKAGRRPQPLNEFAL